MEVIPTITEPMETMDTIIDVENIIPTSDSDLEEEENEDLRSLESLEDKPFLVEEIYEPIDPQDGIVILGYYPVNPYFHSFQNGWGQSLPIPVVGRTVFCGHLESDEMKKVEVELYLQKPQVDYYSVFDTERYPVAPTANAVMRRVVDYGKDMLYVVKEPFGNTIDPLPSKQVQEYSCRFFSVSDEQWYAGNRAPFYVNEEFFTAC